VSLDPLPPHSTLDRYYASDGERAGVVSRMFDEGAPYYEWICRIMSLGTGEQYRRRVLLAAGLAGGMRVLDVATGTGLVLRSAAATTGVSGVAVGLDPSRGMLRECRKACVAPLLQGRGEQLPLASGSFDMVSMGYGLRHVADLRALFAEYQRVLKPGGCVLLLEITQPRSSWARRCNRMLLRTLLPGIVGVRTGAPAARRMMDYFWDTIERCVPPEVILAALQDAGFPNATRKVSGGVLSVYSGTRPR
jgi:demethylmenaquinone methyltransferase / 2-methoxy-6-polyprenyl-1,4-benzoquinol methylase